MSENNKKIKQQDNTVNLADETSSNHKPVYSRKIAPKSISVSKRDIRDWRNALRMAQRAQNPKWNNLQDLFDSISDDALLTSQINNRNEQTISTPFELIDINGKVNDMATGKMRDIPVINDIIKNILDSELFGYSVIELSKEAGMEKMELIPRQNIDPTFGRFYPDISFDKYIEYRNVREYGKWILEFYSDHIGLLNKAVSHVLFKKFAQSCWSELCEIYGIPPRYMKTNTQDPGMLNRAESMMRDMGAAAWFIIDTTEEFQFAQGVSSNGDVYNNLITLCNNEMSLLITGAILGQDTKNGNYSKEQSSIQILDRLVESDKRMVEIYMNSIVIPALYRIGWMPITSDKFRFSSVEDTDKLWYITKELLPYKEVDNEWLTEKFGIPVADKSALSLAANDSFFV